MKRARFILFFAALMPAHLCAKTVKINWSPIRGAVKYELHIKLNETIVRKEEVPAESTSWSGDMPAGAYLYQVRGIDRMQQPGRWSDFNSFLVSPAAPEAREPENEARLVGTPAADVWLKWNPSEGATKYTVELKQEKKVIFKKTIAKTEIRADKLSVGKYSWTVRAAVELKGKNPKGTDSKKAEGPPCKPLTFHVDKDASRAIAAAHDSSLSASASLPGNSRLWADAAAVGGSYNYRIVSAGGTEGNTSALYSGFAAGVGYSLSAEWAAILGVRDSFFKVNTVVFDRKEFELGAQYRWRISPDLRLVATLSGAAREYFGLARPDGDDTLPPGVFKFYAAGPALRTELQYLVSKSLVLGIGGEYYHPLATLGPPRGAAVTATGMNYNVGASGSYRVDPGWALRTEISYQKRPLDFQTTGATASDQTAFSAIQLQVGLHVLFGDPVE